MSISVFCPSCNEENPGSLLLCKKCQASLIGVPRVESQAPVMGLSPQQTNNETANVVEKIPTYSDSSIINSHTMMLGEIRSWALWSLGLGALHIITSGFLSAPWGILLIIVALASFYFKSASMFIIYAVTLAWAAFSNLTSLEIGWILFALYQFYLAFRVFKQYRVFQDVEKEYNNFVALNSDSKSNGSTRAFHVFPWLGSLFGCSSIIGLVLLILVALIIAIGSDGTANPPDYFGFVEGLIVNFGVLGASIGLASLLSKYKLKALAWIGLIGGVLTVLIEYAIIYLL